MKFFQLTTLQLNYQHWVTVLKPTWDLRPTLWFRTPIWTPNYCTKQSFWAVSSTCPAPRPWMRLRPPWSPWRRPYPPPFCRRPRSWWRCRTGEKSIEGLDPPAYNLTLKYNWMVNFHLNVVVLIKSLQLITLRMKRTFYTLTVFRRKIHFSLSMCISLLSWYPERPYLKKFNFATTFYIRNQRISSFV